MADHAVNLWQYYQEDYPLNVMVVGHTDCEPDYAVERKCSHIMAIEYISEGSGILEINGQFYEPQRNSAILLTKGSCHRYVTDKDHLWKKRWVVFDGPFMEQMLSLYLPKDVYCFPDCNLKTYFDDLERLVVLYQNAYDQLLDKIILILVQMVLSIRNVGSTQQYDLAEQIRQELEGRLAQKLSLTELSKHFSYSKNHLIRVFKDKYGVTPYQYYTERKIEISKLYLCNTNLSVKDIASILSFADEHYFSNYFHGVVGISPSAYRQKIQEENGPETPSFFKS